MPAFIDITGHAYGRLQVIARVANKGRRTAWMCRCACGREVVVDASAMRTGNTASCGCMERGVKDETGKRYGRLVVLRRADAGLGRKGGVLQGACWVVRCDCGKEFATRGNHLRRGMSQSCGCYAAEQLRARVMLPAGVNARNTTLRRAKNNAKERGYVFELTDEQTLALMAKPCFYCDEPPSNVSSSRDCNGSFTYSGIDRVDNSRGYVTGNVVPCCRHCNYAKRDRTAGEFFAWIERVFRRAAAVRERL